MLEAEIRRRARILQAESEDRWERSGRKRPLSLEHKFYNYVYQDPRRVGPFTYYFAGRAFTFPYEPFYTGKGFGDRMYVHERRARGDPSSSNSHILNRIRELHRLGLAPIIEKISCGTDVEAVALAKETILIEAIGTSYDKTGPLTNKTKGGEGSTGVVESDETRLRKSIAHLGNTNLLGHKHTAETRRKMSAAHAGRRPRLGFKHKVESKRKISDSLLGNSNALGMTHTEAARQRISKGNKGKKKPVVRCPHCGKSGGASPMARWHFANCKQVVDSY